MRLYWDYVWFGRNEYYKVLCLETKNNDWALFKLRVGENEFVEYIKNWIEPKDFLEYVNN